MTTADQRRRMVATPFCLGCRPPVGGAATRKVAGRHLESSAEKMESCAKASVIGARLGCVLNRDPTPTGGSSDAQSNGTHSAGRMRDLGRHDTGHRAQRAQL